MNLKIFCVFDSKVGAYAQPFVMRSTAEAIRGFTAVANDTSTDIGKYPTDFALFECGEFDPARGILIPQSAPISLGLAQDYKRTANPLQAVSQ